MLCTLGNCFITLLTFELMYKPHACNIEKFIESLRTNEIILNNSASRSGNQRDRKWKESVLKVVTIYLK